ncbi:WXG100 family type VII secretion target [Actinoplanes sp. KI2]|uniref:WXG100 family type VII secretion target n=1 Tax=Actinoplanes sp. KI2 TaxID=2983315 RepID=UPI0021D61251|nr:WXG100 family type VII secretion target [Actinoplanes sp. KI2]MCU7725163.1 WXG100 family type VII secretion target [Actinoplanes sp. KI2]
MAITLDALMHADTGRIRDAAAGWEKIADELDATVEQMARGTGDLPNHWEGDAAEAAEQRNRTFQIEIGNVPHGFHVVAQQLRGLAEKFEHCRTLVYAVVDDARADGMRVDLRTGQISTTGPVTNDSVTAVRGIMDEFSRRLTQILAQANDADRQAADLIDQMDNDPTPLNAELAESGSNDFLLQDYQFLQSDDYSPDFKAQAWNDMNQLNRDRLITEHPELIGPTVGLPTVDRDRANRLLLARAKTDALARQERLDVMQDGAASRATMNTDRRLADIAAVQQKLASTPGARLLGYPPAVIGTADPRWDDWQPPARRVPG